MFPHDSTIKCSGCPVTIAGTPVQGFDGRFYCTNYCALEAKFVSKGYFGDPKAAEQRRRSRNEESHT